MRLALSLAAVVAVLPLRVDAGVVTAEVEVFDSTPGEFVALELGTPVLGYKDRYTWSAIPALLEAQPLHFWRVNGEDGAGTDPSPEYGIVSSTFSPTVRCGSP